MFWIVLVMVPIVALALAVAAFVAFPRRGAQLPALPWVGGALERTVRALPTLDREHASR